MAKNTTYNTEEMYSILHLCVREAKEALKEGETVKFDGLLTVTLSIKVGGKVKMGSRADRWATAELDNPTLWTAKKVSNHANLTKTSDELITKWNVDHPDDPVEVK